MEIEALFEASRTGDVETVRRLLQEGVPVNAQNQRGRTALMLASKKDMLR